MKDADQRAAVVSAMNGANANFDAARERLTKAAAAVAEIEVQRDLLRGRYAKAREAILHSECGASQRVTQVGVVNECLSALEANAVEQQRAKSEEGTAKALVEKYADERTRHVATLAKLLPEVT